MTLRTQLVLLQVIIVLAIVLTAGVPFNTPGSTNILRVATCNERAIFEGSMACSRVPALRRTLRRAGHYGPARR